MEHSNKDTENLPSRVSFVNYLIVFLKGMAMGAADSVPGVSGGTIAVIARIYDQLIFSLRSINLIALKLLFTKGFGSAWRYINGTFLLLLFCGILFSLRLSASTVLALLESQFEVLMAFFIGLVVSSCWFLRVKISLWNFKIAAAWLAGVALTIGVSTITPQTGSISSVYLFFCGVVAICAMILPGLSGAFLLLMLGVYDYLLTALVNLDFTTIFTFASGCVMGLLAFSRLLAWTLIRFKLPTYGFLTGMLLASIYVIWPWQQAVSFYNDSDGHLQVLKTINVSPGNYESLTGKDPQLMLVIVGLVAGALLIAGFDKLFRKPVD